MFVEVHGTEEGWKGGSGTGRLGVEGTGGGAVGRLGRWGCRSLAVGAAATCCSCSRRPPFRAAPCRFSCGRSQPAAPISQPTNQPPPRPGSLLRSASASPLAAPFDPTDRPPLGPSLPRPSRTTARSIAFPPLFPPVRRLTPPPPPPPPPPAGPGRTARWRESSAPRPSRASSRRAAPPRPGRWSPSLGRPRREAHGGAGERAGPAWPGPDRLGQPSSQRCPEGTGERACHLGGALV